MATTAMDYEANGGYDEEAPRYERDQRSASPRPVRDDAEGGRRRSASPSANADPGAPKDESGGEKADDGTVNPGSNLFVTGIHPRLTEAEVTRLFEKYGSVEKCQIMRDPHTKESRGFGFVKMFTSDQADAAKEGLQGETVEGRTLSIEKARRARPRTPTPGKYFGPPKREPRTRFDRYDDRARRPPASGAGPGYPRGEDPYRWRGQGYERRADERGYDRGYREDRGSGYDRAGYRGEYDRSGYDRSGGYERSGYERAGYDRTGYDRAAYDRPAGGSSGGGGGGGGGGDDFGYDDPPPPYPGTNNSGKPRRSGGSSTQRGNNAQQGWRPDLWSAAGGAAAGAAAAYGAGRMGRNNNNTRNYGSTSGSGGGSPSRSGSSGSSSGSGVSSSRYESTGFGSTSRR